MSINDPLNKGPVPTVPYNLNQPPQFSQATETVKDAFIIEIRNLLNRQYQVPNLLAQMPTVKKYDFSFNPAEKSMKTMATIIRKMPDLIEQLPVIAVLSTTGKNRSTGIGGPYVEVVAAKTSVSTSNNTTFALADGMTLSFQTTTPTKVVNNSTITFFADKFLNIAQATPLEVANCINLFAAHANAQVNLSMGVDLSYGGPLNKSITGDIKITGGTALTALGFTVGQQALYVNSQPYHRYLQTTELTVSMEVGAEDDNTRTELTDLLWGWLNFLMQDKQFTFFGRTLFQPTPSAPIPNEVYQVVIGPDASLNGETEVPRPNDDKSKIFINRIDVPVVFMQYIDRQALVPGTTTPLYLDASKVTQNLLTLPPKN